MKFLNINVDFKKPETEIEKIIEKCGGENVRCSSSYSGARVEFRIDDKLDERVFKKTVCDALSRQGYRAH